MPVNRDEIKDIWGRANEQIHFAFNTGNEGLYYYYHGVCDMCRKFFPDIDLPEGVTIDNN